MRGYSQNKRYILKTRISFHFYTNLFPFAEGSNVRIFSIQDFFLGLIIQNILIFFLNSMVPKLIEYFCV